MKICYFIRLVANSAKITTSVTKEQILQNFEKRRINIEIYKCWTLKGLVGVVYTQLLVTTTGDIPSAVKDHNCDLVIGRIHSKRLHNTGLVTLNMLFPQYEKIR